MSEHPILFSAPMIRALLEGRKTQTRRIMKRNSLNFWGSAPAPYWDHANFDHAFVDGGKGGAQYLHVYCHSTEEGQCAECDRMGWAGTAHRLWPTVAPATDGRVVYADKHSPPPPASRLWVREAWKVVDHDFGMMNGEECPTAWLIKYADDAEELQNPPEDLRRTYAVKYGTANTTGGPNPKLRPSIFMPRWASRITLEVTEVRVQRLNDISEEDARAEGCQSSPIGAPDTFADSDHRALAQAFSDLGHSEWSAKFDFMNLWESINGSGSWAKNPWVWAVSFRRVVGA